MDLNGSILEALYCEYFLKVQKASIVSIAVLLELTSIVFVVYGFAFTWTATLNLLLLMLLAIGLLGAILLIAFFGDRYLFAVSISVTVMAWIFAIASLPCPVFYGNPSFRGSYMKTPKFSVPSLPPPAANFSGATGVWEIVFVLFLCYSMIPLPICYIIAMGTILPVVHSICVFCYCRITPPTISYQFGANVAIFLCVNVIGLTMHRILERGMCKSFLDIRNSILVRMDMAAENERLERLLLSILPQPIAAEMKKDTVNPRIIGEFHRVYMQKHESATILFADIVGFTVLSASVTPLELVNILNDLFGTFDHLSKKNGCVRIKLLGDCYYCVAGLTKERPDHALCGVQMGLDIIQAVAEIRKRKDIPCTLNMRVGLHTGKVLSGVIGLRKWQYDVWSNDVTIANQMESAGQPGKVHISDSTFALLEGAFPVEPGQTNAVLKRFGVVKTYFIVPRPNCEKICSGSVDSLDSEGEDTLQSHELGDARAQLTDVSRASLKLAIEARVLQQTNPHLINVWTLAFKERNTEKKFNLHQDVEYVTSISCLLFVHAFLNILSLLMLPRTELLWLISLLFVLWVVLIMVVISEARFEGHCLQITYFSVIRVPACTIAILLLFFAVFLNLLTCYPDIEHCSLTTLPDSYLLLPFLERDPSRSGTVRRHRTCFSLARCV